VYKAENMVQPVGRATVTSVVNGPSQFSEAEFRAIGRVEIDPDSRLLVVYRLRPFLQRFQEAAGRQDASGVKQALDDFVVETRRLRQMADITQEEKRMLDEWTEAAQRELASRPRK
jgi:hypothetical protein